MSDLRIYRVTVTQWPTNDGLPWPRFIEAVGHETGLTCAKAKDLEWFAPHAESDSDAERAFGRFGDYYGGTGECYGYVLPRTGRRHYLSRHAAEEWAKSARSLGAVVEIEASALVTFDGSGS